MGERVFVVDACDNIGFSSQGAAVISFCFFFFLQALGNLYFIHECIEDVMIYDFIGKLSSIWVW